MKKVNITTLFLCTSMVIAGCEKNHNVAAFKEKTYSVAEFEKNEKLFKEWAEKCGWTGTSKNCKNMLLADRKIAKRRQKEAEEKYLKWSKENQKKLLEDLAKREAEERAKKRQKTIE